MRKIYGAYVSRCPVNQCECVACCRTLTVPTPYYYDNWARRCATRVMVTGYGQGTRSSSHLICINTNLPESSFSFVSFFGSIRLDFESIDEQQIQIPLTHRVEINFFSFFRDISICMNAGSARTFLSAAECCGHWCESVSKSFACVGARRTVGALSLPGCRTLCLCLIGCH